MLIADSASGLYLGAVVLCAMAALVHLRLSRTAPRTGGFAWPAAWLLLALAAGSELAIRLLPFGFAIRLGGGLLLAGLATMAITIEQGGTERVFDSRGLVWAAGASMAYLVLAFLVTGSTWGVVLGASLLLTLIWLAWGVWERVAATELRVLFGLGLIVLAVPGVMLLESSITSASVPPRTTTALLLLVGAGLLAAASVLQVVNIEMSVLRVTVSDLEETHQHLMRMTETDPLTGRPTRQALRAWFDSWEGGEPVSVVLIDVDGLKRINDRHGQAAGDEALRLVAGVVEASTRPGDLVVRWGGDEFVALLRGAGHDAAKRRFAGLIGLIEEAAKGFPYEEKLQVSWGVASCASAAEISRALAEADERMFAMKRRKRGGDAGGE